MIAKPAGLAAELPSALVTTWLVSRSRARTHRMPDDRVPSVGQPLSETESLLWNLGQDPNLASTMGLVAVLDGRPDPERLKVTVANTVATVERLRQRVATPAANLLGTRPPEWVTDRWFDLDYHLRFLALRRSGGDGPAGIGALHRLAGQLINDPFDHTRPLWQFHLVTGLTNGQSALIGKVHHSISDGIGLLRLAGSLLEFEADARPPKPVDLDAILAAEIELLAGESQSDQSQAIEGTDPSGEADGEPDEGSDGGGDSRNWLRDLITGPGKVLEAGAGVLASARVVSEQLSHGAGSSLWSTRSRNRRLETCALPLEGLRAVAQEREVSVNDLFVAACGQAAARYHEHEGHEVDRLTATVVVSTEGPDRAEQESRRRGGQGGGNLGSQGDNAFVPVPIDVPIAGAGPEDRLSAVHDGVRQRRQAVLERRPDVLLGRIGSRVPSSIAAALALQQAAKVDFATSNIPGPPVPTWLAGCRVKRIHPVGPVAGTAFNATFMSYDTEALIGLHIDPAAVSRPDLLAQCLSQGFGDFGVRRR